MFRLKIRKAMRLLDKEAPGWRARIEPNKLDLEKPALDEHGCGCVLAQTFGSYWHGLRCLGLTNGVAHGLSVSPKLWAGRDSVRQWYRLLTKEWREELQRVPSAQ